jgi:hypothetical protein
VVGWHVDVTAGSEVAYVTDCINMKMNVREREEVACARKEEERAREVERRKARVRIFDEECARK